jgi:hypothetical protein
MLLTRLASFTMGKTAAGCGRSAPRGRDRDTRCFGSGNIFIHEFMTEGLYQKYHRYWLGLIKSATLHQCVKKSE